MTFPFLKAGAQPAPFDRASFEQQIQQSFSAQPLETRQILAAIYPVRQATRYSWAQMSPQQQQQVIAQLRQQNTQGGSLGPESRRHPEPDLQQP